MYSCAGTLYAIGLGTQKHEDENDQIMGVKNMGPLDKAKERVVPYYECSDCKRRLEKGEFIAIIGKTPPTGLSAPMGRADAIFERVGKIYCEECFKKRYESK